jgi:phosphatidylethanolamine-binding protein (PEBP) family uncharacterized protein
MWDEFKAPAARLALYLRGSVLAVCLLAAAQLASCGAGGSSSTVPSSPAASAPAARASSAAVAYVAGTPIPKSSYAHWRSVEARLGAAGAAGHEALGFLLTSQWVLDEAAGRGLSTSEADVKRYLARLERRQFPQAGMLRKYLTRSGETEADLLARARVELLRGRIAAAVGSGDSRSKAVLASFERAFRTHWRQHTTCRPAYVMEDCSEYRGTGESFAAGASGASPGGHAPASTAPGSTSGRSHRVGARGRVSKPATLNIEQELPPPRSGEMALSSPAFELNGPIPSQFTCDGAGISPPLSWQNVPANAAALILFVIDDETPGSNGGIRWVVGDIDPKSMGVGAGETPRGGIVGANAQGHASYGAICPAPGATTRVEFDMYALSKRIPLTTGFEPSVAVYAYSRQKLLLGKVAATYGGYHRP